MEAGVLFVASLRKVKGKLTAGMRLFRLVDREKWSDASIFMCPWSSRMHLEFLLDCACMDGAQEDRESLMCRFAKDCRLHGTCEDAQRRRIDGKLVNEVSTSDVQALVEDSDQEVKFD